MLEGYQCLGCGGFCMECRRRGEGGGCVYCVEGYRVDGAGGC